MRIHSSSLTFTPASFNRQQVGRPISAQNKDEKNEPLAVSEAHIDNQPNYSSKEISRKTDNRSLPIDLTKKATTDSPLNTRASRALSAYSLELNTQLVDHSARAIQGIDTYA
jgi:hypothetical protein